MMNREKLETANILSILFFILVSIYSPLETSTLLIGVAFSIVNLRFYIYLSESILMGTNQGVVVSLIALKMFALLLLLYILSQLPTLHLISGLLGIFSFLPALAAYSLGSLLMGTETNCEA